MSLLTQSDIPALLAKAQTGLARREGQYEQLQRQLADFEQGQQEARREAEIFSQASTFLLQFSEDREASVYALVQDLVSQGLTQVFDEELTFKVVPKSTNSRFSIDFQIESRPTGGDILATPVLEARGGGVAAVAGFLLQVVMILLSDAPRVVLLDEVFAQVSAEYEPRLAEFLTQLVDEVGLQVELVTHSDAFDDVSDASYRASLHEGATTFNRSK